MSNLHFDPFQFAGRRRWPVAAEFTQHGWTSNGIAYEDRMQTAPSSVPLRHKRWTPAFAASDDKLRRVLLQRAWFYLHGSGRLASAPDDWKTINDAATKKALESKMNFSKCPAHKRAENKAHMAAVKQAGGYLELQAALAYRAWRLGHDSVGIAEALGMSPQSVRVNLQRLCNAARDLDFETFPRHYSLGKSRGGTIPTDKLDVSDVSDRIIALYKAGHNVSQIAQAIGYPKNHGNNRVRQSLLKVGIYTGRGPGQRVN
jgi:hypothetical protein